MYARIVWRHHLALQWHLPLQWRRTWPVCKPAEGGTVVAECADSSCWQLSQGQQLAPAAAPFCRRSPMLSEGIQLAHEETVDAASF